MERNVNVDLYLTLEEDSFNEVRNEAKKEAEETYGDDESCKETLLFGDCNWECEELYFDKDNESIELHGDFTYKGKKLGYLSPTIKVSSEMLIEIIEHYMKKMGKLKTVMEAIK